jgi:hypothetical protein
VAINGNVVSDPAFVVPLSSTITILGRQVCNGIASDAMPTNDVGIDDDGDIEGSGATDHQVVRSSQTQERPSDTQGQRCT